MGTLTLTASQDYVLAGGSLSLNWSFQAKAGSALDLASLELELSLPAGFALPPDLASALDPATQSLILKLHISRPSLT